MKIPLYCPTEEEVTDHTHINGRLCVCSKCGREQRPAAQVIARALAASNGPVKCGRPFAFTPEQIEAFRERRRNGESIKEIAESVGKKHWTLYPYLRGIKPAKPEFASAGPRRRRGRKPAFTPEQVADLVARRRAGASIPELMATTGKDKSTVGRYLKGIYPDQPAKPAQPEKPRCKPGWTGKRKGIAEHYVDGEDRPRLVRLLNIVRALIGGQVHTPTLAKRLGVSERSIERDLKVLGGAGFTLQRENVGVYKLDIHSIIARAIDEQEEQA
jgi:transposase